MNCRYPHQAHQAHQAEEVQENENLQEQPEIGQRALMYI